MRYLLVTCLVFFYSVSVLAQTSYKKRTPEEKARYYTDQIMDNLKVSDSLDEALYQINLAVSKKFDSVYAQKELDPPLRKKAFRNIYQFRDSCLKATLTTKHFLMFQDIERERYEKKRQATENNPALKKEED